MSLRLGAAAGVLRLVPPAVFTLLLVLLLNNFALAAASSLLPVYVEREIGLPPMFSATLLALETALGGLIALVAGAVTDRFGHRGVLALGLTLFMAGMLRFTSSAPWLLVLLSVALGMGHGLRSTAAQSYVLSAARSGAVGVATAAYFLGGTLGSALGTAVAGPIIEAYGFALYALVGIALNLIPIGVTIWKLPGIAASGAAGRSVHWVRDAWSVIRGRDVLLLGGLRYLATAAWGIWSFSIPLLLLRATDSVLAPALYVTTGLVLATVVQFAAARWSDRRGRSVPMYVFLGGVASAAGLAAAFHSSPTALFGAGILATVSAWTLSMLTLGTVHDRTGRQERGRAVGFVHALWSFGILSGSLSAGVLLDLDPAMPLALAGGLSLGALGMAVALFRRPPTAVAVPPAARTGA